MYRYLAIVWDVHSVEGVRTFQSFGLGAPSRSVEWTLVHQAPGALVLNTASRRGSAEAYLLKNNSGVILGKLFERRHGEYAELHRIRFDEAETKLIVASGGQHLLERYWGSYVAILHEQSVRKHHVFRDPIGNMPCRHATYKGVDLFFSDIEDCVRLLPIAFTVDRKRLARWLIPAEPTTRDTGIENVENLLGGERLTLSAGRATRAHLWNPIEIARHRRFEQPDEAARELRSTVQNTLNAWASCYDNIALRLSGGLDSSIVAGCLAQAPSRPQVTYLNMSIDVGYDQEHLHLPGVDRQTADKIRAISGHGDERYFARLVAERWKSRLIERERSTSMDLTRLWQTPLTVNPSMYFTSMEMDDAGMELIRNHGTEAFFSGQAGDSIFLATSQPLSAIDHAYLHGLSSGLWEHIVATCRLSKESLWSVLRKVLEHGVLRRPYTPPLSAAALPTLLTEDLAKSFTAEDFKSDLARAASSSRLPPGKQNHVRGLADPGYYDYVFHSGAQADHVDPLNSQPIWELVLAVPAYTMLTGGISRGLARRAFADLLPAEVRRRQVKGTGMPFYQQLVRRNRALLREHLLDGLLVQEGYLDRQKLSDCLTAEEPFMLVYAPSMLMYLAAEIWLRQWTDVRQRVVAQRSAAL